MPALVSVRNLCDDAEDRDGTRMMLDAVNRILELAGWTTETILSIPSETGTHIIMSWGSRPDSDVPIDRAAEEIAGFLRGLPNDPDSPIYLTDAFFLSRGWNVSVWFRNDTS